MSLFNTIKEGIMYYDNDFKFWRSCLSEGIDIRKRNDEITLDMEERRHKSL